MVEHNALAVKDDHYLLGTRWKREEPFDPATGEYNGYTVILVTNTAHAHPNHPPQVVYLGDNGHVWSTDLATWPQRLIPE